MFRTETCLIPVCDSCGRDAEDAGDHLPHYSTEHEAKEMLENSECYEINERLLCAACWVFNDEGERVEKCVKEAPDDER